jgi:retrotransposon gag protein
MAVSTTCDAMLCKFFPTTLLGLALNWYTTLPPGSVDSFAALETSFLDHFVASKRQRRSNLHLMSVIQKEGESVTSYIQRFHAEVLSILGATNATTVLALINGVRTPKLKWKLLEHDITTYSEVMDIVQRFIWASDIYTPLGSTKKKNKSGILRAH